MSFVLDTHVLLWMFEDRGRLSRAQARTVAGATAEAPLLLSEITLWEIAVLQALRRIRIAMSLRDWLEMATAPPLVQRCRMTCAIAAEVAGLPRTFHRDPADRIIVATARVHGATLLTADRRIIDARLVRTMR